MAQDPVHKWIMRRPLLLLAACLASGMAIGWQNAVDWRIWGLILLLIAGLGLWRRKSVFFFAAALPLGALMVSLALMKPTVLPQDDAVLTGRISSEPTFKEEYVYFTLDQADANGEALPTRVMLYLYCEEPPLLPYGAGISVSADLYLPSDRQNPYADSYSAYLWRQGVALCATASAEDLILTFPPNISLTLLSIRCRMRLQSVIDSIYSEDIAPLISALLLGDRSLLPDDLYSDLKTAGLAHLLAISGLHISCLAFALDFLLRRLRCPGAVTAVLVTLFLLAYSAIIGFPASVLRAVLMYVLTASARLLGRPSDGLTGLSLALIILLLINPLSIADVSLILSFSSVAGLLIFPRLLRPRCLYYAFSLPMRALRWVCDALAASLGAQLGALPAVACVFGSLSTCALLANLPALPLMTLSLPFAMVSVLIALIAPAAGALIAFLVEWPLRALIVLTNQVAALPGAVLYTPMWPVWLILAYIAVCLLISPVSLIRRRTKRLLICLLPLVAGLALLRPFTLPTDNLEILFLDAGQADAAVIRAEDTYYLMDVGEDRTMATYLSATGIRPAGIFLSHPHSDHAGGLEFLLDFCPPGAIYLPCLWNEVEADEGIGELLTAAQDAGWIIRSLQSGDMLRLSDNVSAHILQPFPGMTTDANGASLCMRVSIGKGSVLFTGDLITEDEFAFFPDCDVLKVAHHGAKSSTSSLLLSMISPSVSVISSGYNSYGHPAPETLARLNAAGTQIYITDLHGAVSALLNPDGLVQITPMNPSPDSEAAS